MAAGYLELPEESAAAFRDGWFLSSDVGALLGPRLLHLAWRLDDLVNVGGIKVPASRLEASLRDQPALADAAAVAVHLAEGAITLGLAVVLAPGATLRQAQVATALWVDSDVLLRLLLVSELPRLASGRVDRQALLRLFRQHA